MTDFYTGAPQLILQGTDDHSARPVPRALPLRPTHFPLAPFYAVRGPKVPRPMMDGDQTLYGADTFNPLKKWYNHATPYLVGFLGKGNAVMGQRIVPEDAAPPAAARFCIELLKTKVDIYERNSDGSIKVVNNVPVTTGAKIDGYKSRFSVQTIPDNDVGGFGKGTVTPGTWEDPDSGDLSEIIPLWDMMESSQGEDGNLTGYNIFAPTSSSRDIAFDERLLSRQRTYPIAFRMGRRATKSSTPTPVRTLSGTTSIICSLQKGDTTLTGAPLHMADILVKSYNRVNDSLLPDVFSFIDQVGVYQNNLDRVVGLLYEAEKAYVQANPMLLPHYDFNFDGVDETHVMNFLGACTFSDYPYHSYRVDNDNSGFRPSMSQWVSLSGGTDGTMSDAAFSASVKAMIAEYADNYSPKQDDAKRVESIFYDTGYPLEDKYELLNLLAIRKDLALVLSTHVAGEGKVDAAEQYARASALRARASLFPESVVFGTGVARVQICGRSGLIIGSNWNQRVAGTYEYAMKYADFMGAGNRVWDTDKQPSGYPNSLVTELTDIDVGFTPVDQRVLDWDVGLNWIQNFDQRSQHIPAYRSVYEDDTSVLTSFITMLAIIEINKVCQLTHRKFTGSLFLTNGQLAERVDREIANELKAVFRGLFKLEVETTFTDRDLATNYSWTTVVRIGAAGMKTVMTASVESYRIEDMA